MLCFPQPLLSLFMYSSALHLLPRSFSFQFYFFRGHFAKGDHFFLSFLWRSHLCSEGLMFTETTKPLRKDGIDVSHCRVYVNGYRLCDDPTIISVLITRSSRRVGRGGRNSHPQMFFLSTKWRPALLINSLTDISLPRFH